MILDKKWRANICGLVLLMALAGCGNREEKGTLSVLFISVDTLRSDHLGCYGYPRATSPTIDKLASDGVVFDNMLSTSSWTLPTHASMLTGRYPAFHGLQDDGVKLPPRIETLAGAFKKHGYRTLGVVSHVYVSSEFGLDRGFDVFDDSLIKAGAENPIAEEVVDRFLSLMSKLPDGPFFAFIHFFDPHWDYTAPEPYNTQFSDPNYTGPIDGTLKSIFPFFYPSTPLSEADRRQMIALYDGEIAYVDSQLGRLLKALREQGRLKNTVIVFTADHGEEFKEHGQLGHGRTLFEEQLRVPLIISGHPSFRPGTRRPDLVSQVDLAPTLLELAGAKGLDNIQGKSIVKESATPRSALFAESIRFGLELRAVREQRHKLIDSPGSAGRSYFDLVNDPQERRPLSQDPTGGALSTALQDYAMVADSGWHLKLLAWTSKQLRCKGPIQTTGRFVEPRHYFSDNVGGSRSKFLTFEVSEDAKTLTFDMAALHHMGEIVFETDPPDASVTFEVRMSDAEAGVFLGRDERVPNNKPITLERADPRLVGVPADYQRAATGWYIRAVRNPAESATKTSLSKEAIERLKTLGYTE